MSIQSYQIGEFFSKKKQYLYWSVEVLSGEAHDDKRQSSHAVKRPLSKAEVVDQCVDVCWDDVKNSHNALKWRHKFHIFGFVSCRAGSAAFY